MKIIYDDDDYDDDDDDDDDGCDDNNGEEEKEEGEGGECFSISIQIGTYRKNQLSIMRIFACKPVASARSLYQKTFYMMYEDTIDQGLRSAWSDSYEGRGQPTTLSRAPHAFRFVPCFGGITGDFGSLESFAHPGHYLRHSGYSIYLKRMTNRYAPSIEDQTNLEAINIKSHIYFLGICAPGIWSLFLARLWAVCLGFLPTQGL